MAFGRVGIFLVLGAMVLLLPAALQFVGMLSWNWASNSTCLLDMRKVCCQNCTTNPNREGNLFKATVLTIV